MDRRAAAVGGQRQAPRVLQGMQPEGRANAQRAVGGGAPRVTLDGQPLAIQELHVPEVEAFLVDAQSLPEHRNLVRPMGDVDPAVGLDVAGEIFLGDELAHALARVDAEPEGAPRRREPPPGLALLERELAERDHREAAVAPRGAPPDLVRLQDHGVEPVVSGEPVGGREPSVPATEDRHLRAAVTGERREPFRLRAGGRCPVGGDVSAHRQISVMVAFRGRPIRPGDRRQDMVARSGHARTAGGPRLAGPAPYGPSPASRAL